MAKYNPNWDPHITLKQPRLSEEEKIEELTQRVAMFFSQYAKGNFQEIIFDQIVSQKELGSIMALAQKNEDLLTLQKELCANLSQYKNYQNAINQTYEENFKPHLTLADELTPEKFAESLHYFQNGFSCKGVVSKAVLVIVDEITKEKKKMYFNL